MKRYTVSAAREKLAEVLDQTERGVHVIIERRGIKYRVSLEQPKARPQTVRPPSIEILNTAVNDGRWTWDSTAAGLKFRARRRH
jgi:hypothetical protein